MRELNFSFRHHMSLDAARQRLSVDRQQRITRLHVDAGSVQRGCAFRVPRVALDDARNLKAPVPSQFPGFLDKYAARITQMDHTPQWYDDAYGVALRITPQSAWTIPR